MHFVQFSSQFKEIDYDTRNCNPIPASRIRGRKITRSFAHNARHCSAYQQFQSGSKKSGAHLARQAFNLIRFDLIHPPIPFPLPIKYPSLVTIPPNHIELECKLQEK
jgi:hypothetical protein